MDDYISPLTVITKIHHYLNHSEPLRTHFAHELLWLTERERIWREQKLRIGIIGITSAGKSTLVNSLINQRLLPHAVRPSSNTLVLCQWAETAASTVYFLDKDRPTEIITGEQAVERLVFFADEASNPGNREGVKEIVITSPAFRLGRDIVIVDTPGLDAFGFIEHEKLTLDVLLPTVDLVLFVTTCKANSDARIAEYIGKAVDYRKPVIVAQNMIDSIVPKRNHEGEIVVPWSDIAKAHASRMIKLLNSQGITSGALVQVSALWALTGRLAESGLPELVTAIQEQAEALKSNGAQGRLIQLRTWLEGLITRERLSEDQRKLRDHSIQAEALLHSQITTMDQHYEEIKEEANTLLAAIAYESDVILKMFASNADEEKKLGIMDLMMSNLKIPFRGFLLEKSKEDNVVKFTQEINEDADDAESPELEEKEILNAQRALDRLMKWQRKSSASTSALWQKLHKVFRADCKIFNLRVEDMDFAIPRLNLPSARSVETIERQSRTLKPQEGFFASLKRGIDIFDAEWGYDEEIQRWRAIKDPAAFKTDGIAAIEASLGQFIQFLDGIKSRSTEFQDILRASAAQQLEAVKTHLASVSNIELRLQIADDLAQIADELRGESPEAHSSQDLDIRLATGETHSEISVTPIVAAFARLASLVARQRFLQMRDDRLGRRASQKTEKIMLVGFDQSTLEDTIAQYWFDVVAGPIEIGITTQLPSGLELTSVLLDEVISTETRQIIRDQCQAGAALFLVIDAHQIGATHNQLSRCQASIHDLSAENQYQTLVLQGVSELVGSGQYAAGLWELRAMAEALGLRLDGILALHDVTLYGELADTLVLNRRPMTTLRDEIAWLTDMRLRDEEKVIATEIIREWKEAAASQQGREGI